MNVIYEYQLAHKHSANTYTVKHSHTYWELVYYYEGSGFSHTEAKDYQYKGGDIIIYPRGIEHDETHNTETSVYCIGFNCDHPEFISDGLFMDKNMTINLIIDKLRKELTEKSPFYLDMVGNYIESILININRSIKTSYEHDEKNEIIKLSSFISENLQYNLSIATLADMAGYSYDYFRHIFKKYVGLSPKEYLSSCQLEEAKKLLEESNMKICDVASSLGFITQEHFSIFFKKKTGIAPIKYRANKKS